MNKNNLIIKLALCILITMFFGILPNLYGSNNAIAQTPRQNNINVTIVVKDKMGPAIGATVIVKGLTKKGGVTDENGKVTLLGIPSHSILVISYH